MTNVPRLRVSPEEARIRALMGQIANKSMVLYGRRLNGKTFGKMFGVSERTATNRMKDPDKTTMKEFRHYADTAKLTDAEILECFGR